MTVFTNSALTQEVSAFRQALVSKNAPGMMGMLQALGAEDLARILSQTGFEIPAHVLGQASRAAIFASVRDDLGAALHLGVDGFALKSLRGLPVSASVQPPLGASIDPGVSSRAGEFDGDLEAARLIQDLMRSSRIEVQLMGSAAPSERQALLLVAGQAVKNGVQGFGVDGIPGKYVVPLELADLSAIYRDSAVAVAQESARRALGLWASGQPVSHIDEWVPESTQRLLTSTLSLESAQALLASLDSRSFETHAGQIGEHGFETLLRAQGFDAKAPTVEEQAENLGLLIQQPNRAKGQYFGSVVGLDHRAGLVKVARSDALVLPFKELKQDQARPLLGDAVHMAFKNGLLAASVTERASTVVGVGR